MVFVLHRGRGIQECLEPMRLRMATLLSRAYRRHAVINQRGDKVTLNWYPVPDHYPIFPYPHAFESNNYLQNYDIPTGIGEVKEPMRWTPDVFQPYSGLNFCGDPSWYLNGVPDDAIRFVQPCRLCVLPPTILNFVNEVRSILKGINQKIKLKWKGIPGYPFDLELDILSSISTKRNYIMQVSTKVLVPGAYSDAYSTAYDSEHYVQAPI